MAIYYVDSAGGNDSNTSAQAQNSGTPWRTIAKVNSFWGSLNPGDTVSLKRNSIFTENLIVSKSGSSGNPITINDYGSGALPVITGFESITTWTAHPTVSGVYQSPVFSALSTGYYMYLVSFQGVAKEMGRYPNSGSFLNYESAVGITDTDVFGDTETVTDNQLPNSPSWVGAELVMRRNVYVWSRSIVTQHNSGGNLVHFEPSNQFVIPGFGYFFQNDIKCLDTVGDWYYDTNAKRLNVYFGGLSPSGFVVRAATIKELLTINGYSYINVNNIYFQGANERGIRPFNNAHHINVTNCIFEMMGIEGVCDGPEFSQPSVQNFLIDNCEFDQCLSNGIKFTECSGVTITNNQISNCGLFPGASRPIWGDYNGILIRGCDNATGQDNLIQYNDITNCGYGAIYGYGHHITIKNNYCDGTLLTKSDGGGIYWYYSNTMTNRVIEENIVLNSVGTAQASTFGGPNGAVGIYMDDNSAFATIRNNIVAYSSRHGLYFHNNNNMVVQNNIVFGNPNQIGIESDDLGNDVRTHVVTGNVFVNKYDDQVGMFLATDQGSGDVPQFFTTLNNNYYIDAFRAAGTIINSVNGNQQYHEVQSLNTEFGWEASQLTSPVAAIPLTSLAVVGSNKAGATSGSSSGDININIGSVLANTWYRITVDVTSSSNQRNVRTAIIRNSGAFENIAAFSFIKARTTNPTQVVYMKILASTSGLLVFRGSSGITYSISNLNVVQLSGTDLDRDDYFKLVYNRSKSSAVFSIPGTYVDHTNTSYAGSITLAPYAGKVLFKVSGNVAPIVSMGSTQTVTLPTSTASISGTATDPDGTVSGYAWTKDSGPAFGTITSPTSPSTTVTGLVAGTYVFRLTATDNLGATNSGTQTVVVNAGTLASTDKVAGRRKM